MNSRAGYPTYTLSRGASSPLEYFRIGDDEKLFLLKRSGGGKGIRTLVGLLPNGFQDRLVMTASISLRVCEATGRLQCRPCVSCGQHYKAYHTLALLSRGFGIFLMLREEFQRSMRGMYAHGRTVTLSKSAFGGRVETLCSRGALHRAAQS